MPHRLTTLAALALFAACDGPDDIAPVGVPIEFKLTPATLVLLVGDTASVTAP